MYKTFNVFPLISCYQKQTFYFLRILVVVGLLGMGNIYLPLLRTQTVSPYFSALSPSATVASTSVPETTTPSPARLSRPSDLPTGLYQAYLTAQQNKGGTAYNIQASAVGELTAVNPAHNLTAKFSTEGLQIGSLQLQLNRVGYLAPSENAPSLVLQGNSQPQAIGNRVEYSHAADFTEWYVNGPLGLEQGFTLHQALPVASGVPSDQLELQLSLRGVQTVALESSATGEALKIVLVNGQVLNYGGLYVYDTLGKVYPANFRLGKSDSNEYQLNLVVSKLDEKISYPLTIDPTFSQAQELTASDGSGGEYFGWSVALSADGNTALIGAYRKKIEAYSFLGAAYVFTRSGVGANYVQVQEFTANDGSYPDAFFGNAVALSADGNTALIGAYGKNIGGNSFQGAAYVFTRSGVSANYTQAQRLTASDGVVGNSFGFSVTLSSDGNTALIGTYFYQGAVYVFTRSGVGVDYTQAQRLTATNDSGGEHFGWSVALSADGNTALIGTQEAGAAYVFARSGVGANYNQAQRLTASSNYFGKAVALSADGNTALIGAYGEKIGANFNQGAAYIFQVSASVAITSSASTLNYGENTVVTATVTFPVSTAINNKPNAVLSDRATFYLDNSPVNTQTLPASGVITYGVNGLAGGTHVMYARYNGTAYGAANSSPITLTVINAPTAVSLQVAPNSTTVGNSVNFTATVSPVVTGIVSFVITDSDNLATTIPISVINGVATYITNTLAVGNYSVEAAFGGNVNYFNSTSSVVNFAISKIVTSINVFSSPNPSLLGQPTTFTAAVTPEQATGMVTFKIGSANVTTSLTSGIATYVTNTLPVGSYLVTVAYIGNGTYAASTSSAQYTHTVACNPLVVTAITDNGSAASCGTFSFALGTATSGQTITFALTQGNTITFTGSLTPTVPAGVTIDGGVSGVTLEGNGVVGDGLRLVGNNTISNLTIRRFTGRELVTLGSGNNLYRVRLES